MKTAYHFFLSHAGWSYDPAIETSQEGRKRCAREYAEAEKRAHGSGIYFRWHIDLDVLSSDWIADDEDGGRNRDPWRTWVCVCYSPEGEVLASCGGIDFGRDGKPWGDNYRRVMEAELACEAIKTIA